jgi:hypothetical protein
MAPSLSLGRVWKASFREVVWWDHPAIDHAPEEGYRRGRRQF